MSFPVQLRSTIPSYSAELVLSNPFPRVSFPSSAKTERGKWARALQTAGKRSPEPFHQQFHKEKGWHALPFQV